MHLLLSTCSIQGLWVLDRGKGSIESLAWLDSDNCAHSEHLASKLKELLESCQCKLSDIHGVGCLSGPGAFTGLRVASSFARGLTAALKIPLYPIPSADLYPDRHCYIPLRHLKASQMSVRDYLGNGHELLELALDGQHCIRSAEDLKPPGDSLFLGFLDANDNYTTLRQWPDAEALSGAFAGSLSKSSVNPKTEFRIDYGLGAKVFGKRQSQ